VIPTECPRTGSGCRTAAPWNSCGLMGPFEDHASAPRHSRPAVDVRRGGRGISVRRQRTISTRKTHALTEAATKVRTVPARIQYNPPPEPASKLEPPPMKASAGNKRSGRFPSVQLSGSPGFRFPTDTQMA